MEGEDEVTGYWVIVAVAGVTRPAGQHPPDH